MLSLYGLTYFIGCISFAATCYIRHDQVLAIFSKSLLEQASFYRYFRLQQSGIIIWICTFTIIGGRLGYVVFYEAEYFLEHPLEIVQLYKGGMSFHGAILGCIVATCTLTLNKLLSLTKRFNQSQYQHEKHAEHSQYAPTKPNLKWYLTGWYFDCLSICALWMIPLGRICNFINGEAYGRVTTMPWGVIFLNVDLQARHPSQLYEATAEGPCLALILWWLAKLKKGWSFPGEFALHFLAGYGILRFGVEFSREADATIGYLAGNLTLGQILCLAQSIFAVLVLIKAHSHSNQL